MSNRKLGTISLVDFDLSKIYVSLNRQEKKQVRRQQYDFLYKHYFLLLHRNEDSFLLFRVFLYHNHDNKSLRLPFNYLSNVLTYQLILLSTVKYLLIFLRMRHLYKPENIIRNFKIIKKQNNFLCFDNANFIIRPKDSK